MSEEIIRLLRMMDGKLDRIERGLSDIMTVLVAGPAPGAARVLEETGGYRLVEVFDPSMGGRVFLVVAPDGREIGPYSKRSYARKVMLRMAGATE